MSETEDAIYVKNLESLVQERTHQWQIAMREQEKLVALLKQIQSMESVEEIRPVVQAAIAASPFKASD